MKYQGFVFIYVIGLSLCVYGFYVHWQAATLVFLSCCVDKFLTRVRINKEMISIFDSLIATIKK